MSCESKLRWYELIPLFSFFALRGRCRTCKTKISIQYPLVELVTGLIFTLLFLKFQDIFLENILAFGIIYDYYAVMFSLLLVIAVYDLKHKIIPDSFALIFGALAFIGLFFFHSKGIYPVPSFYWQMPSMLELMSGVLAALPFALLWLVSSGRWMGLGDAKLVLGIGWLLGPLLTLSSLVIAFWSGAIMGLCLIIISAVYGGSYKMRSEIPFAPFLVFGAITVFLFDLYLFAL